jgi:hypothetical protein
MRSSLGRPRQLIGHLPQLELGLRLVLKLEPIVLQSIQITLQFKWQLRRLGLQQLALQQL